MIDPGATPTDARRKRATRLGVFAGCSTFIVGMVGSWAAAKYAIRGMPPQREVFEAMYWDGLWSQWCCGGGVITTLSAGLAAGLAYRLAGGTS